MIDKSLWKPEELSIFEEFKYKCIRCGNDAVTLHELIPKSLAPKTWRQKENRVPLCEVCHLWAHKYGIKNSRYVLEWHRSKLRGRV